MDEKTPGNAQQGAQQSSAAGQGQQTGQESQQPPEGQKPFQAPASQAELDRIVEQRLARERAKYADYDDLKAKAEKAAQAEKDKLSVEERNAKEIAELKASLAARDLNALRAEVAAAKGVPATHISGNTREEMEASADDLLGWRQTAPAQTAPPATGQGQDVHQGADMSAADIVKDALGR